MDNSNEISKEKTNHISSEVPNCINNDFLSQAWNQRTSFIRKLYSKPKKIIINTKVQQFTFTANNKSIFNTNIENIIF